MRAQGKKQEFSLRDENKGLPKVRRLVIAAPHAPRRCVARIVLRRASIHRPAFPRTLRAARDYRRLAAPTIPFVRAGEFHLGASIAVARSLSVGR